MTSLALSQCASNHSWSCVTSRALWDLDVQFDVPRETGPREVARANKGLGTHDLKLRVGDISLGVEFVLVIDTAFDLPGPEGIKDGRDPVQEGVGLLVLLNTFVEPVKGSLPDRFENGLPSPMGGLRPHQDSDFVESLPVAIESE